MKHVEWACPMKHEHVQLGKFQSCFDEWFFMTFITEGDCADEEGGDATDGPGYFWLFKHDHNAHMSENFDDAGHVPEEYRANIVELTPDGSVYVYVYNSHHEAEQAWQMDYAQRIAIWDGAEPDEWDGIIWHERGRWYVYLDGKLQDVRPEDRDGAIKALAYTMEADGYYPNCFEQDERGYGYTNINEEVLQCQQSMTAPIQT